MTAVIMIIIFQFIENNFSGAERGQSIYFHFEKKAKFIDLKFDAPQEKPYNGWTIEPHIKPSKVSIVLAFMAYFVL